MMPGMTAARYDGHAEWYDETFGALASPDGSAGLLAELLGPADPDDPTCVDVGCGTGLHFATLAERGYRVVGADLSGDQLRIARTRNPAVAQADATRLPLPGNSVRVVVMTFTHTDLDDFAGAIGEAARILKPGGRLVYLGLHPAYVGAFVHRGDEVERRRLQFEVGYGDESLRRDSTGRFPVRSRVGARNLTLSTLLGAFLMSDALRIVDVVEYDTNLRRWSAQPSDGRVVPWNISVTALRDK
jgi:SAM-dependent methyltransferase